MPAKLASINLSSTRAAKPRSQSTLAGRTLAGRGDAVDSNTAPSQWGRRLARLVGEKYGVQMSENRSKNEGTWRKKAVAIKCAKSLMPPVSLLTTMMERLDVLWAIYLTPDGGAQIWSIPIEAVREHGYFTRGPNVQKRVEVYHRKAKLIGKLMGTLSPQEVESCEIP